jgi:hypothetical protein
MVARPDTVAHQRGLTSLPLRALRLWRLYRLYRNSDATVPSFRDPRSYPPIRSIRSPNPLTVPLRALRAFRLWRNSKPLSCLKS